MVPETKNSFRICCFIASVHFCPGSPVRTTASARFMGQPSLTRGYMSRSTISHAPLPLPRLPFSCGKGMPFTRRVTTSRTIRVRIRVAEVGLTRERLLQQRFLPGKSRLCCCRTPAGRNAIPTTASRATTWPRAVSPAGRLAFPFSGRQQLRRSYCCGLRVACFPLSHCFVVLREGRRSVRRAKRIVILSIFCCRKPLA